jgi:hypothetical protein
MSNIVIDIAAQFTGKKAFKQAETSTEKLTKNVKKLAQAVGLGFGTAQVLAFGKASVKAALEAQAQQERLANLVKVTVGATDAQVQSLNDQAAALQAIGVVNKENITQTQSQLATFNLQIDTIKTLTPAILDYVTAEKGAAASADQFKQMTNGLAQALNGNFASLTKVGFVLDEQTKKTIKSGTETERAAALVKVLDSTYKDFNKNLANTPTGQMQKLANAADDAKQIIGEGLLDALKGLGEDDSVQNLALSMQNFAIQTANVIRGIGKLIEKIQALDDKLPDWLKFDVGMIPIIGAWYEIASAAGQLAAVQKSSDNQHLKALQDQFKVIKKTSTISTKLTADELKKLNAKKLQLAIDKANLALNKGEEVFDIDKIQIAAALTNQAQLLGKATDATQRLQIANDVARLNVKRSILALEDAIASKDEAAIIAATAKLNADLKILGALTNQKTQMVAIESILNSLKPKDLINQSNLDAALRKIQEMIDLLARAGLAANAPIPRSGTLGSGIPEGDYIAPIPLEVGKNASIDALIEASEAIQERANAFAMLLDLQTESDMKALSESSLAIKTGADLFNLEDVARRSMLQGLTGGAGVSGAVSGSRYAAQAAAQYNLTVNTGIGDPEAIARAIEDAIRQSYQRGTSSTGLLAV